jgi:hypothetical protein
MGILPSQIELTQDFLALLGVRRATVTAAAEALQPAGLEAAAYECSRLNADRFDELLGPAA